MPQYRRLYVKSVDSQDINDMPDDFTRLLWVMLPLGLDREGRGIDNAGWVKAKVFPLRDDVTNDQVATALNWFSERKNEETGLGMIERYEVSGRRFFYIPTWHTYQGDTMKETQSVIPAPTLQSVKRTRKARATLEPVRSESVPSPELVKSKSVTDSDSDAYTDSDSDSTGEKAPASRPRDLLFDAICKVCVIDPKVKGNGGKVGKIKAALLSSEPPYTPDEVIAFGTWWNSDEWRCSKGPPTVWKLTEQIGIVRNGDGKDARGIGDKFTQAERMTRERLANGKR